MHALIHIIFRDVGFLAGPLWDWVRPRLAL